MDGDYFRKALKRRDLTSADLANAIGRDRTVVSKIFSGLRPMRPNEAEAAARLLDVPLDEVLEHAGLFSQASSIQSTVGFSESDAVPFKFNMPKESRDAYAAEFGFDRPGVDVWTVQSDVMILAGYRKDDTIVVDANRAGSARDGDDVLAQIYDYQSGSATTVFRRYDMPVIHALSGRPTDVRPVVVDNRNVIIAGVVIGSWRKER